MPLDSHLALPRPYFHIPPERKTKSLGDIPLLRGMKWRSGAGLASGISTVAGTSISGITNGRTVGRRGKKTTSAASTRKGHGPTSCGGSPPTIGRRNSSSPDAGRESRASSPLRIPLLRGTTPPRRVQALPLPTATGEPLSLVVDSSARASRGPSIRRIRSRHIARGLPSVHGRVEDGLVRHRPLLFPLLLLPRLGRENVPRRRLRR